MSDKELTLEIDKDKELVSRISYEFHQICEEYFSDLGIPISVVLTTVHVYFVQLCLNLEIPPDPFKKAMDKGAVKYKELFESKYGNKSETK
jgi:hypothetical protein